MASRNSEWIWGKNPVLEVLRANRRPLFELQLAKGSNQDGQLEEVIQLARQRQLEVRWVHRDQLPTGNSNHQGTALRAGKYPYGSLDEIYQLAEDRQEPLFVLLLDVLKDPQNLGTLLRTAEAVGVQGIVLPYRRTATVTPAVVNASSGASEHLVIIQGNLAQTIDQLKDDGAWVVGLEGSDQASSPGEIDLTGPMAVVVGSEGEGMRRLVRSSCDFLLRLPMRGQIESLNAAVAGSIALYFVWQARGFSGE